MHQAHHHPGQPGTCSCGCACTLFHEHPGHVDVTNQNTSVIHMTQLSERAPACHTHGPRLTIGTRHSDSTPTDHPLRWSMTCLSMTSHLAHAWKAPQVMRQRTQPVQSPPIKAVQARRYATNARAFVAHSTPHSLSTHTCTNQASTATIHIGALAHAHVPFETCDPCIHPCQSHRHHFTMSQQWQQCDRFPSPSNASSYQAPTESVHRSLPR